MSGPTLQPDAVNAQRHDPLELLTLDEVSAITRRSRRSLYEDIAADRLHIVKLGRSTRVPRLELERYLRDVCGWDPATIPTNLRPLPGGKS